MKKMLCFLLFATLAAPALAEEDAPSKEFRERMEPVLRVHREFFKDHYPAWTAVGTTALFSADAPMELRAVAIIGSGRAARAEIPLPVSRPDPGPP